MAILWLLQQLENNLFRLAKNSDNSILKKRWALPCVLAKTIKHFVPVVGA